MSSGIYEIRNMVNGNRYIGSAKNLMVRKKIHFSDLSRNVHHCSHLQNAYNVYGKDSFIFTALYECQPEELLRCEQEELDLLKPEYNTCRIAGNSLGRKHSDEIRKKISANIGDRSGKNNPFYGRSHSEETKRKLSELWVGEKNPNYGKPRSDEVKQKISQAKMGHITSEETKQKIKASCVGLIKNITEESRKKMSDTSIKMWGTRDRQWAIGRKYTEEAKRHMSEAQRNRRQKERDAKNNNVSRTDNS